jgi:hypothetical protein
MALLVGVAAVAEPRLVLYSQGFALVEETREVLLAPEGTLVLEGFPRGLLPDSLTVAGLDALAVRFTLWDPAAVPGSLVGEGVEVLAKGDLHRGTLLAADGKLVLATEDGLLVLPEYELIRAKRPAGTRLSLDYATVTPGETELCLRYLAQGFGWRANYIATLVGESLKILGLATLENRTGVDFPAAQVELVAGEVYAPAAMPKDYGAVRALAAVAEEAKVIPAFEYHRYLLPTPVDLGQGSVSVPYVSAELPCERIYRFQGGPVEALLRFENQAKPLPAGEVRAFDQEIFIGAARIDHTPVGEEVELAVGAAFDLQGERTQVERRRLAENLYRETWRITLRSAKEEAVEVEAVETLRGDWKIISSSLPYEVVDAGHILFRVPVPAQGEAEVTYTVEYSF